jgi:hypothetical protein
MTHLLDLDAIRKSLTAHAETLRDAATELGDAGYTDDASDLDYTAQQIEGALNTLIDYIEEAS